MTNISLREFMSNSIVNTPRERIYQIYRDLYLQLIDMPSNVLYPPSTTIENQKQQIDTLKNHLRFEISKAKTALDVEQSASTLANDKWNGPYLFYRNDPEFYKFIRHRTFALVLLAEELIEQGNDQKAWIMIADANYHLGIVFSMKSIHEKSVSEQKLKEAIHYINTPQDQRLGGSTKNAVNQVFKNEIIRQILILGQRPILKPWKKSTIIREIMPLMTEFMDICQVQYKNGNSVTRSETRFDTTIDGWSRKDKKVKEAFDYLLNLHNIPSSTCPPPIWVWRAMDPPALQPKFELDPAEYDKIYRDFRYS